MAKKQAADDKVRFELRFDGDVYGKLATLAEEVGVSVNQLMQGLTRWAVDCAHAGEFDEQEESADRTREQPGCVWFGDDGFPAVQLDFTERRVVLEPVVRKESRHGAKR